MKLNKLNWKKFILGFYLILVLSIFYHVLFAKRIIPGVKVGDVRVGGLSYEQALDKLKKTDANLDKKITFKYEDKTFEITDEEIGFVYDWDSSIARAYEIGRTGNLLVDTKDKIAGLFKSLYLAPFYDYEDKILENELLLIKGEISRSSVDAKIILKGNTLEITDSEMGYKVSEESLKNIFVYAFDRFKFGEKDVPVYEVSPTITKQDLEPILDKVTAIVLKDFSIQYTSGFWKLEHSQMLDIISFSKDNNEIEMALNSAKFGAIVDVVKREVDVLPRGQVTKTDGTRVLSFELTQEGKTLDEKKFSEDFKTAFFGEDTNITVATQTISQLDKDTYGIYALIGEGKSKYTGSGSARVNNLILAAKRTNGVLVPPGGIYSMNRSIGEISSDTGYDTAYVISEGKTVLGEGGGVCQTSTTLFRAVLNSGLPIVMRYPHDYRVYYYEIDSSVGFDASIYQPSLDFQFKNDTPNYVLVQAEWDLNAMSLTFKLYGTPDGRTVEISEPVVTGVTPPPDPLYQDDPTLAKGVVKQIDFSAWGSNVSFNRVVKRDSEEIINETFSSRYQPWRAIYLVGTKVQ